MTPITSPHDVRLVTLIGVAISAIEEAALALGKDPDKILAEALYLSNKQVHEVGEEYYTTRLHRNYPLLEEAIK